MRKIWVPQLVVIGMLVWALNPTNPYGYYILLRWVCFGVFGYLALQAFDQRRQGWVWILGITAGLYNPIVPVHMTREIWSVINIATVLIAAASIVCITSIEENHNVT